MSIKFTEKQKQLWKILDGDKSEIMAYGGSRSGKTFAIIRYIIMRAMTFPKSYHLIGRKHLSDIRATLISDTIPKVCELLSDDLYKYWTNHYNKAEFFIQFPNKSQIRFNGFADAKRTEKILGSEFSTIYLNEISQFGDYSLIEKLMTRLAQNVCYNKILFDCNPTTRAHWAYKKFIEGIDPVDRLKKQFDTAWLMLNPIDNLENLPSDYIKKRLSSMSTRQRARFELGLWQSDVEGSLWTCEIIEKSRADAPKEFERIVVAVDPAVTCNKNSDETGIIVGALANDKAYVLEDMTAKLTPEGWAKRAIKAYHDYKADAIVAEVNNGGDLVSTTIKLIDRNVRVKQVRATRGKAVRAEPVVALYEQGRVKHTKVFDELENQQTSWTQDESYSPDRMDALVWLITNLLIDRKRFMIH